MGDKVNPKIVIHPRFEIKVLDKGKKGVLEPGDKVRFSYLDKKGKIASSCKTQKVSTFLKVGDCKQKYFRPQDKCSHPAYDGNDPAEYFKAEALKHLTQTPPSWMSSSWMSSFRIKWSSKDKGNKYSLNASYKSFLKKHLSARKPFKLVRPELSDTLEGSAKELSHFKAWHYNCLRLQGKNPKPSSILPQGR